VKHIIDAHGQTINVRSKMGVGTTFAFTLQKAGH
jgi:two-component system phosphate regulon sensor histidine kinase PhoR